MKRSLNKINSDTIEQFLIKASTGSIEVTRNSQTGEIDGTTRNLFQYIDETKQCVAFLRSKGFDPFKRGTKEPAAIKAALEASNWAEVSQFSPEQSCARSMLDGAGSSAPRKSLLTKEIEARFAAVGSQENVPDPIVIAKFFNPDGAGTWLATEYDPVNKIFYGYAHILEGEYGSFSLAELESIKGRLGLGVERDRFFSEKPMSEAKKANNI